MYEEYSEYLFFEERFITTKNGCLYFFEDPDSAMVGTASCILNCVSLQEDQCGFSALSKCEDFIRQFQFVMLVPNDEESRKQFVGGVRGQITYLPLFVAGGDYKGCKTVRDLYDKHGMHAIESLIYHSKELPAYGLLNISEVTPIDVTRMPRVLTGIRELDKVTGGSLMGDVSIWTGKRGDGKSTLVSQIIIEAVDQGKRACAYSGELKAERFKDWLYLQAAGPNHITSKRDAESDRELYFIDAHTRHQLDEWFDKRLFLYDLSINSAHDADSILRIFEYANKRYGCSVFLVDNIMTARFASSSDSSFYREQSNFVGRLVEFANRFNSHVHIVAHPRKGEIRDGDDVSGISDITNRAANVFKLERLSEDQATKQGCDSVLSVMKNRAYGDRASVGLCFEPKSRRFFKAFTGNPDKKYGWEFVEQQKFEELT
ncbi:AAA family ATPase [Papillibacter cinnamivorans]|uniref:Twinkle protein n=1 Tax=Papillibacter cinnamivorans DSM 12816 TaxID=1122930 RepID=A0A1W1YYB2_9FIRM|nr:AAA family ATPase [Papillibacter cinnamivorans]SMC41180.1 twinkle protein [Papillibacter cinnamivorans DSM 12816]